MTMFALLTLPRGVPVDPETRPAPSAARGDEPVGIIIRPGPVAARPRLSLSAALAAARA
ncbi:MAG TPA: hypothetical protein VFJ82_11575 [Longimicrobium sp.]|nr:hypothetical protein [Longimicrobium sp.]